MPYFIGKVYFLLAYFIGKVYFCISFFIGKVCFDVFKVLKTKQLCFIEKLLQK